MFMDSTIGLHASPGVNISNGLNSGGDEIGVPQIIPLVKSESLFNQEGSILSQVENVSLEVRDVKRPEPDLWKDQYSNELAVIRGLCKKRFFTVDDESLLNMCSAMRFAGIKSLQDAVDLKLEIIPPGPVFHTWYAYRGTTIFDGANNGRKLNYVDRISEEASFLENVGIPVFIVYTENSMSEEQVQVMRSLFSDHPNIVTLSIEQDLRRLPLAASYQEQMLGDPHHLDGIRGSVLMNRRMVLKILNDKASKENKIKFSERLKALGAYSLIYSDIDNLFLRKPPFMLAYSSFVKCPLFRDDATRMIKAANPSALSYLPHHGGAGASINDIDSIKTRSSALYDELLRLPLDTSLPVWRYDIGFYMVGRYFCEQPVSVTKGYLNEKGEYRNDCLKFYDMKQANSPSEQQYATVARLHGLQLVNYLYVGRDLSYRDDP